MYSRPYSFFLLLFFIIIIVLLWLDEVPFLLSLDSEIEGSVVISMSVVSDACVPPEGVERQGSENNIGVVSLMVVADP